MLKRLSLIAFSCSYLFFVSCDKETGNSPLINLPDSVQGGVFILNEGNFQQANATLGYIDYEKNLRYDDVFEPANGRKVGDVLQSMCMHNGKVYLVLNNSGKIEIINPKTFKSSGTITGLTSPRVILPVSDTRAYVSDLYDNALSVIDLNSNVITSKISLPGWSEEMLFFRNKVYVTNLRKNYLSIVDAATNLIVDTIETPFAPKSLVRDSAQRIWVLCGDNQASDKHHFLIRLDSSGSLVEKQWELSRPQTNATRLRINASGNRLYWLDGDLYSMSIYDTVIPILPIIPANGRMFYALEIEPQENEIWVSDVKDFNSNSNVHRYDKNGYFLGVFTSGKITGSFYFF